jgi:tetratricopeptide (TPR) repeat protein
LIPSPVGHGYINEFHHSLFQSRHSSIPSPSLIQDFLAFILKPTTMKRLGYLLLFSLLVNTAYTQITLTMLPSGGNKKAAVSEQVGLTRVSINYDRPGVKGREGKIWGQLVPVGFTDPEFGSSKSSPWRAGANENTTIEFSTDVMIEGKALPAGKYGFFIAYDPNECTLIFSKNSGSWGHYYYNEKEDALRVNVKPVALDKSVEWLKYEFSNETENSATISLQWEKLAIPFKLEVDYIKTQIESFRQELRTDRGFFWLSWNQAANWCLQRNTNLEEALLWADSATSTGFGGDRIFGAWATKARILQKLGKSDEAAAVMKKALPLGNMTDLHQYGRQLLNMKMAKDAFDVFKMNFDKNPNQFTTCMGLARGYSAIWDFKNALKYANLALPMAPDEQNKTAVKGMIEKLKDGKDVN